MSIFNEPEVTTSKNEEAAAEGVNAIVAKLMEIKRPDGTPKYTDPIAALDALKASQEYISTLENENAQFKEKVKQVETLEETIKRLSGNNNNNEKPNPQTVDEGGRSVEAAEELVRKIVKQSLEEDKQVNTAVSNLKKVDEALIRKYGDKAGEVARARAKALGTTPEMLKQLSAQNPDLVLELFGGSTATPSLNNSSVNLGGYKAPVEEIKSPDQSLLSGPGATHDKQLEFFRKIKDNVNKRLNVES
jgi:hypothetical protein